MPLSESLEPTERPDTDDTEEAVDTERSSCGTAFSASIGETHGSGESVRSGGGEGVDSMAGRGRCGGYADACSRRRGSGVCLSAAESAASHLRSPRSGGWVRLLGGDGRRLSRNLSHSKLRRRERPTRRPSCPTQNNKSQLRARNRRVRAASYLPQCLKSSCGNVCSYPSPTPYVSRHTTPSP